MNALIRRAVERPRRMLAFFLMIALLAAVRIPEIETDNSVERWLGEDAGALVSYREFIERYGYDEFVAIALEAEDPLSPDVLNVVDELTRDVEAVGGVTQVLSLSKLARSVSSEQWPPDEETRQRVADFARESELCKGTRPR